jgi:hypothetical protein
MKSDFQRSSDLQNAYMNLQVEPSSRKEQESRYSRTTASISSGNSWKEPIELLELYLAVYWFPEGLMPKGWCGIEYGDSVDPSSGSSDSRTPPLGWISTGSEHPGPAVMTKDFIASNVEQTTEIRQSSKGRQAGVEKKVCCPLAPRSLTNVSPPFRNRAGYSTVGEYVRLLL